MQWLGVEWFWVRVARNDPKPQTLNSSGQGRGGGVGLPRALKHVFFVRMGLEEDVGQ